MPFGTRRPSGSERIMRKTRLKQTLAIISVLVLTIGYGWYRYREQRMDRLYAEASGPGDGSSDSAAAQAAVREIATYRGATSTEMLMNIALGRSGFAWPDVQREAIKALASRDDSMIAAGLSSALQPHYPLTTRQAATEALRVMRCPAECVNAILHYLERVMGGEPNYEDRTSFPTGLNVGVKSETFMEQQLLYSNLFEILKREKGLTLDSLVRVYGLGTDAPSKFSLALVSRMQFRDACPAATRSAELARQSTPEYFLSPRDEIQAALDTLKCQ